MGRRHKPFFRINVVDDRTPRDGKILEKLGHYDPLEKDPAKQIVLSRERVEFWLNCGAIPTDTVSQILLRQGIKNKYVKEKKSRRAKAKTLARAKGKPFTKMEKNAAAQAKAAPSAKEAKADAGTQKKAEPKEKTGKPEPKQ